MHFPLLLLFWVPVTLFMCPAFDPNSKEGLLQRAVQAFRSGEFGSNLSECARQHKVSYHTLRRRTSGQTQSHATAHTNQQYLTPAQEEALVSWVTYNGSTGHANSKSTLRFAAQDLARAERPPTLRWVRLFKRRHPDLCLKKPVSLDPKRAKAFNRTIVEHHFELLSKFMEEKGVEWENVWNMDEKGIQMGGGRKNNGRKYFFSRKQKSRYHLKDDSLELVTVIEAVLACGDNMPPGFVFAGRRYAPDWFKGGPKNLVAVSENGWTSDFICTEWFKKTFAPEALARSGGKPIVLMYDGHGSHIALELRSHARAHDIHLYKLPPHTTHRLQPLDVGIFGPIQRWWQEYCDRYLEEKGTGLHISQVVNVYMEAREQGMRSEVITKAWNKSGLNPINPGLFTDFDYAPSKSSSSVSQLPSDFPGLTESELDLSFEGSSDPALFDIETESLNSDNSSDAESLSESDTNTHEQCEPPKLQVLTERIATLEHSYKQLTHKVKLAEAHCQLSQRENGRLRHMLYGAKDFEGRVLDINAEVITSEEGMAKYDEIDQLWKEKSDAKESRELEKVAQEQEIRTRRLQLGENMTFTEPLSKLQKPGLRDLCWALGLSENDSVKDLKERIQAHFESHPDILTQPQFSGLAPHRRGANKRARSIGSSGDAGVSNAENVPPRSLPRPRPNPHPSPPEIEIPIDPALIDTPTANLTSLSGPLVMCRVGSGQVGPGQGRLGAQTRPYLRVRVGSGRVRAATRVGHIAMANEAGNTYRVLKY